MWLQTRWGGPQVLISHRPLKNGRSRQGATWSRFSHLHPSQAVTRKSTQSSLVIFFLAKQKVFFSSELKIWDGWNLREIIKYNLPPERKLGFCRFSVSEKLKDSQARVPPPHHDLWNSFLPDAPTLSPPPFGAGSAPDPAEVNPASMGQPKYQPAWQELHYAPVSLLTGHGQDLGHMAVASRVTSVNQIESSLRRGTNFICLFCCKAQHRTLPKS